MKKSKEEDIKLSHIKEAVEYLFRNQPIEKAKRGDKSGVIDVIQAEGILSFKINGNMLTGKQGFLNILNMEDGWSLRIFPIIFNGEVLDEYQTEEFWKTTDKWLKDYEKEQK